MWEAALASLISYPGWCWQPHHSACGTAMAEKSSRRQIEHRQLLMPASPWSDQCLSKLLFLFYWWLFGCQHQGSRGLPSRAKQHTHSAPSLLEEGNRQYRLLVRSKWVTSPTQSTPLSPRKQFPRRGWAAEPSHTMLQGWGASNWKAAGSSILGHVCLTSPSPQHSMDQCARLNTLWKDTVPRLRLRMAVSKLAGLPGFSTSPRHILPKWHVDCIGLTSL